MTNSHKDQDSQLPMSAAPKPKRMSWLLYFGIAFLIAIWTALGGLFFLAVVWVLRMNPSSDASFTISDNEKKTARRIYTWLFFSPILTVPLLISILLGMSYTSTPSLNQSILTILISALLHTSLLFGLTSKSTFVYRHTQQGILMISLRTGIAGLAVSNLDSDIGLGLGLFFLGNGALWLISSIVGWNQVSNGKCWFMDRKGEKIISLEDTEQVSSIQVQEQLNRSRGQLNSNEKLLARNNALSAFRHGDIKNRQEAVEILNTLGEVEKF